MAVGHIGACLSLDGCLAWQILEEVVKYRWGALPDEQREGIKNYISNLIIKLSSEEATFRRERMFLNKLNLILVQVSRHVLHAFLWQTWQNSRYQNVPLHEEEDGSVIALTAEASSIYVSQLLGAADPQAGLAASLEELHTRYHWCFQDKRDTVREQHDHPQAVERRGF